MRIGGRVVSPAAGCVRICGERDGHDAVFRRGPEECGWQMCAFIELGGVIFELPAPRVCEPGRSLRNFPVAASLRVGRQPAQRRFSSDLQSRGAACGAPADEATAQLRASAPGGCGPRGSKSRKFSLQYHPPASVAASPAQQSPGKKTVATRGAKYNKGRHPLSCASARGLRPKSCVRERTSPAPVQCPDLVRPRHANCR